MKYPFIAGTVAALAITCVHAQNITLFSENFEGAAAGATAGTNAQIPGTALRASNRATGVVVDLNDPANAALASAFSSGSGKVLKITDGGGAFGLLEPVANPVTGFGTVLPGDTYTIYFDIYVPDSTTSNGNGDKLLLPIGNCQPRLKINPTTGGTDPTLTPTPLVQNEGLYAVQFTGPVSAILNSNSPTQADSCRPSIRVNQLSTTNTGLSFPDIAYIDNISFVVTPAAATSPVVKKFEMGMLGGGTGEKTAYLFTSGDNSATGVYTTSNREIYYDVDGVTSITLNSDAPGFTPQVVSVTSPATGVITPVIPSTPGIYTYTLDATNGLDTVTSQEIKIHVNQPYAITASVYGGGNKLSTIGTLRYNLSFRGDYDSNAIVDPVKGTFSIAGIGSVDVETTTGVDLEIAMAQPVKEFSANFIQSPRNFTLSTVLNALEALDPNQTNITYPVTLTASFSVENQIGIATSPTLTVIVDQSDLFAVVDPANAANNVIPNQYSDLFIQTGNVTSVPNADPSVTFANVVQGGFSMGTNETSLGTGFKTNDATISLWVRIPEAPTGHLILDLGGVNAEGTTLGYDSGNLVARMQFNDSDGSQVSAPVAAGWHHVVLLLDIGTPSKLTMYVDGGAAIVGSETTNPVTNWFSGSFGADVFGNGGGNSYSGAGIPLFPASSGLNGQFGHLRAYKALLAEPAIQQLAGEFLVGGAPTILKVESTSFSGGSFSVTVSGLKTGTSYYLRRNAGLSGGMAAFTNVSSLTAASGTAIFTDTSPLPGKAFYVVSDVSNP